MSATSKPRGKRREKARHMCPNCGQRVWGQPGLRLACGICCIPLEITLPPDYPEHPRGPVKLYTPSTDPDRLPLEQRVLPPLFRRWVSEATITGRMPWLPTTHQPNPQP